jgi:AcrR family transcriptional regulator
LAVGVSPSAAYRHFEDKAALLQVIAQDAFREMGQRFQSAMASVCGSGGRAARARFMAQGHAYVGFALEQPERFAVMFGPYGAGAQAGTSPQGAGATMSNSVCDDHTLVEDTPYASLSRVLDELLAAGVIDSARRPGAELLAWSAIHGLATLLVSQALKQTALPVEAMVDRVGQDCLRALMAPTKLV